MKSIMKLVLVVFLFSSVAFAEGEMGNGGKPCPGSCIVASETTAEETKTMESTDTTDSVLVTFQEYWDSMLQYFES